MTRFIERWRGRAKSLAAFGDSVTQALHISDPADRWPNRLAAALGAALRNLGLSGTIMQASPDVTGQPRANSGRSRYARDLLGPDRADLVAILYGLNDARYTAAPATLNRAGFERDYRAVLGGLFDAGYAPETIVLGSPPHLPDAGFTVGAEDGFAGQSRAELDAHVATVRTIARDAGTYYAPVNERMRNEGGDSLVLDDHVHPNAAGHARIAEIFAAAERLG